MSTYVIAEAGVNHNGDLDTACRMIDAAKECGCDCVKFQTFKTELLVTKYAAKADYQTVNTGSSESQFEMLKKLELSYDDFGKLKDRCDSLGIDFLSTPFDDESVDMLYELGMKSFKMSSGDITNKPLLEHVAKKGKPVILSTGMCTMDEVEEAVGWIEACGNKDISLLHCTSNYPTPYEDVNMRSMLALKERFPYKVGYSDHTKGIIIPMMAVSMGAEIIEKHFTLDKNMNGPDHKASLEISELKEMVGSIRQIESAFGDGIKRPSGGEISTREVARKSIIVKRRISAGTIITDEDLSIKRPGSGLAPKFLDTIIGKRALKDMEPEYIITPDDYAG